mmetsp:Transcript_78992/g.219556  ORF Transcript_78992/g.219556 Transcript_78992/m.219556 type:complete len:222 (+) Transcript_78992:71-736(+)
MSQNEDKLKSGMSKTEMGLTRVEALVRLVNMVGASCSALYVVLGFYVACCPIKRWKADHWIFDRLRWWTQGVALIILGATSFVSVVYIGVLRRDSEGSQIVRFMSTNFGFLRYEVGRAIFYLLTGFYAFPLLDNLDELAHVNDDLNLLGYFTGLTSIGVGAALLFIDVLFQTFVEHMFQAASRSRVGASDSQVVPGHPVPSAEEEGLLPKGQDLAQERMLA